MDHHYHYHNDNKRHDHNHIHHSDHTDLNACWRMQTCDLCDDSRWMADQLSELVLQ
jgi:hypothetical protein